MHSSLSFYSVNLRYLNCCHFTSLASIVLKVQIYFLFLGSETISLYLSDIGSFCVVSAVLHHDVVHIHIRSCSTASFVVTVMGVYTREGCCMECSFSVYNIGNAVSGSKLGGIFISREPYEWIGSTQSYFFGLRDGRWSRSSSEGTFTYTVKVFFSLTGPSFGSLSLPNYTMS